MAGIVTLSFAFTWIYNNTERSILDIIVLYGWVNFTAKIIEVPDIPYYALWFVLAGVIVAIWDAKTMTTADEVPHPPLPSDP